MLISCLLLHMYVNVILWAIHVIGIGHDSGFQVTRTFGAPLSAPLCMYIPFCVSVVMHAQCMLIMVAPLFTWQPVAGDKE